MYFYWYFPSLTYFSRAIGFCFVFFFLLLPHSSFLVITICALSLSSSHHHQHDDNQQHEECMRIMLIIRCFVKLAISTHYILLLSSIFDRVSYGDNFKFSDLMYRIEMEMASNKESFPLNDISSSCVLHT